MKKLILALVLLAAGNCMAYEYYPPNPSSGNEHILIVTKEGNDANDPHTYPGLLTIDAAVAACVNGDIIIIGIGTWDETVGLDANNKSVTLWGMSNEYSIIYPSTGGGHAIVMENYSKVINLYCKGGLNSGAAGINCSSKTRPEILHCIVEGTSVTDSTDGLQANSTTDMVIKDSIFISPFDGATIGGAKNFLIERCVFKSTGNGIDTDTRGLLCGSNSYGVISNCSFYNARTSNNDYDAYGAVLKGYVVANNCLFYATASISCDANAYGVDAAGGVITNSAFYVSPKSSSFVAQSIKTSSPSAYPTVMGNYYLGAYAPTLGGLNILDTNSPFDSNKRVGVSTIEGEDATDAINNYSKHFQRR